MQIIEEGQFMRWTPGHSLDLRVNLKIYIFSLEASYNSHFEASHGGYFDNTLQATILCLGNGHSSSAPVC